MQQLAQAPGAAWNTTEGLSSRTPAQTAPTKHRPHHKPHPPNTHPVLWHHPDKAPQSLFTQPRAQNSTSVPQTASQLSRRLQADWRARADNPSWQCGALTKTHHCSPVLTTHTPVFTSAHQCSPVLTSAHQCSEANRARLAGAELESSKAKPFIP